MSKMIGFKEKRAKEIDKRILELLKKEGKPVSTREIAMKVNVAWHTIDRHCLRLQMSNTIDGYRISNINVWVTKK